MLGIIIIPPVFGVSASTLGHAKRLRRLGFLVEVVDPYSGKRPPFFLAIILAGTSSVNEKIKKLATSFSELNLFNQIDFASASLREKGASQIGIVSSGFGSNIALRYLEKRAKVEHVVLHAWFPHIPFPKGAEKYEHSDSIKDANLANLSRNIQMFFYYGDQDEQIEPENLAIVEEASKRFPNIHTIIYPRADHAFDARCIQGYWPNTLYWNSRAARRAYRLSWENAVKDLLARSASLGKNSFSK